MNPMAARLRKVRRGKSSLAGTEDRPDRLTIDHRGDRSRQLEPRGVDAWAHSLGTVCVVRFSCLVLSLLLPLNTFDQAHLLKQRPFRATDTVQSGGDHICDLRSDVNGDGRPERLGDYVRICGSVIAEPSTYETGGWLLWIRDGACGMMIYGEQECLSIGDSIEVTGCLRRTTGGYFFPETGLATKGDLAVENMGVTRRGRSPNIQPVHIDAKRFAVEPQACGGNLVALSGVQFLLATPDSNGDLFIRAVAGGETLIVYVDLDTGIDAAPALGRCGTIAGIAVRMRTPPALAMGAAWCIAPRSQADLAADDCTATAVPTTWGRLKALTSSPSTAGPRAP